MGRIMIPEMRRRGYEPHFAAATAAAGGVVGVIIPPSLIFIIYGVLLGLSPGDLFIAGILPGVLMVASMTTVAAWISKRNGWDPPAAPSLVESARAARSSASSASRSHSENFAGLFRRRDRRRVVIYGLVGLRHPGAEAAAPAFRSATINGLIAPIVAFRSFSETFVTSACKCCLKVIALP
jgi:TRAP-type C4-dicarboxylate transport system permease large subunit